MRPLFEEIDDAISERVDEVLLPLMKSDKIEPQYSEVEEAIEEFMKMLPADGRDYRGSFEDAISVFRSYTFGQCRACYIQGLKDYHALMKDDLGFLDELKL